MEDPGNKRGGDPADLGLSEDKLRAVAKRPVRGSLKNFLRDLRTLPSFATLKKAVTEFRRDDALGFAAQLPATGRRPFEAQAGRKYQQLERRADPVRALPEHRDNPRGRRRGSRTQRREGHGREASGRLS